MQICLVSSFKVFRCLSLLQVLFVSGDLSALRWKQAYDKNEMDYC